MHRFNDLLSSGVFQPIAMRVEDKSLPQAELEKLVEEPHAKICPYSHATRGNVEVNFEVIGG